MFVEPEKRENCCPYARFYTYRSIGVQKLQKEAVKCLFKGTVHDPLYIKKFCSGQFKECEIYKREEKIEDWRAQKNDKS